MLRGALFNCKTMLLCGAQGVVESKSTSLKAAAKSERTKAKSISLAGPEVHVKDVSFGQTMVPLMISGHLEAASSCGVAFQSARSINGRPSASRNSDRL